MIPHRIGPAGEKLLEDFEEAWRSGTPPRLELFLTAWKSQDPADSGWTLRDLLVELVKVDLEYRWRRSERELGLRTEPEAASRGEPNPPASLPSCRRLYLEDYVAQWADLGPVEQLPVDLIGEEYRVRRLWGDGPDHEEFTRRFGRRRNELPRLLARIDAELLEEGAGGWPAPPPATGAALATTLLSLGAFLESVRDHQLLEPARRNELVLANFPDAAALATHLVAQGWLTPFQADLVLQGRGQDLILGPYILLEPLGEGAMGLVLKARHQALNRLVALKVFRQHILPDADPDRLLRFHQEIRAAGRLSHPHVVQAFDAGRFGTTQFLVMEYVAGIDLARLIDRAGPLPVGQACDYVRQAALGLQHVHECGLVHRDIKPSNLIVTHDGDRPGPPPGVEGQGELGRGFLKILDLGLARLRPATDDRAAGTITRDGVVMGTPDYMAPEQAQDPHAVDIRADLYSLGCTFYFLLTGRPPFPGGTLIQKINKHRWENAAPVERLRPDVPPAVAGIVRRLMAKRPADRYPTPAALVAALQPWAGVDDTDISGRTWCQTPSARLPENSSDSHVRPTPRQRRQRWIVASAMALLVGLALVLCFLPRRDTQPPESATAAAEAPVATAGNPSAADGPTTTARLLPAADTALRPLLTREADLQADLSQLRAAGLDYVRKYPGTPQELVAAKLLMRLPSPLDRLEEEKIPAYERSVAGGGDPRQAPTGLVAILGESRLKHWSTVSSVALSPDGALLASASMDGTVKLWESATGREQRTLTGHKARVMSVAFRPDGRVLASGSADRTIKLWDVAGGQELRTLQGHDRCVNSVAFRPDGQVLASGGGDGTVRLWDPATGVALRTLAGHTNWVHAVTFRSDGRVLASGSADGTVQLWDPDTGAASRTLRGHQSSVLCLAFRPDGRVLASGGADGTVRLWEAETGNERGTLAGTPRAVTCLVFAADGRTLVAGGMDGAVRLWDPATAQERHTLTGHDAAVWSVAFSSDGRVLASGSADGTVKLWNPQTGKECGTQNVISFAFRPDGKILATGSADGTVRLWDVTTGQEVRTLTGHRKGIVALAFRADGEVLATGSGDHTVKLWETATGKELHTLHGHRRGIRALAFRADGEVLATGSADRTVKLWETATGKELRTLVGHRKEVFSVAFRAQGQVLASVSRDAVLKLWEVHTGKELRSLRWPSGDIHSVAFRRDGRVSASGGADGIVKLVDVDTGTELYQLAGHRGRVHCVAFRLDGRLLASAAADGAVGLWETASGTEQEVLRLGPPFGIISQMVFSPDGRYLATVNRNGTVYIFRLARRLLKF